MQNNVNTCVERIIAKIDNDFNPDNSDWIPRVGAWCIDAMSQLNVLRTKRRRFQLTVINRIAHSKCPLNNADIEVFDENGCKIEEAGSSPKCDNCSSTGGEMNVDTACTDKFTPRTITREQRGIVEERVFAETINGCKPPRYNVQSIKQPSNFTRNYVLIGDNKLELNYDTKYVYVDVDYIETVCSDKFNCELPVIPNNGILIEAITYYCMFKMLTRGYKHPVFNLNASQYGTNPYYLWNNMKDEARRSVANTTDGGKTNTELMRSNLYIETFNPRR